MSKGPHPLVRFIVYPILAIAFLILCYFIALLASGYKLEYKNGQLTKTPTGMIVLATKPGDAAVFIDGKRQKRRTPAFSFLTLTAKGVAIGDHNVRIEKEGYETFEGIFSVEAKLVTWLNYVILVPQKRELSDFKIPGNITGSLLTDNKTKLILSVEDEKTGYRTLWEINLQTKEKRKFHEEKITLGEKFQLLSVNNNATRILSKRTLADKDSYIILENKENGSSWDLTALYRFNFDNFKFSPASSDTVYSKKDGDLYKLDYVAKNMSASIASKVVDFYTNNSNVYIIKETESNIGLWRLDSDNPANVVKVLPASETYQFKHLKNKDTFLILSGADKELLLYERDTKGNPISKSIARGVIRFELSPKEKRIVLVGESGARVYDFEKEIYFDTVKDTKIDSVFWFNDDHNIVYSVGGKVNLVTYLGHYKKELFDNLEGTPVYTLESSPNIYLFRQSEDIRNLFGFSFNF